MRLGDLPLFDLSRGNIAPAPDKQKQKKTEDSQNKMSNRYTRSDKKTEKDILEEVKKIKQEVLKDLLF